MSSKSVHDTPVTGSVPSHLALSTIPAVRWKQVDGRWEMQTAVRVFHRQGQKDDDKPKKQVVELHAQLHFGHPEYFELFNSRAFNKAYDAVLYELLTESQLLEGSGDDLLRRLLPDRHGRSPVSASPNDHVTAKHYGWSCQVDVINYSQPGWLHADFTREEFLDRLDKQKLGPRIFDSDSGDNRPLWERAQGPTNPILETAAAALWVGPPQTVLLSGSRQKPSGQLSRRLFTNLFLPGSVFGNILRGALWFCVPSPEVYVLLLDWSSLFRRERTGKSMPSPASSLDLSPLTLPLMHALSVLDFQRVRQMVFGQVVVAGSRENIHVDEPSLLIAQRNDRACKVLDAALTKSQKVALLYGCQHCPDLETKLQRLGFQLAETEWRTAWSVTEPNGNILAIAVPFLLFLAVSGFDWIATWDEWITADDASFAELSLLWFGYAIRHLLLYIGVSKILLLDWRRPQNSHQDHWY